MPPGENPPSLLPTRAAQNRGSVGQKSREGSHRERRLLRGPTENEGPRAAQQGPESQADWWDGRHWAPGEGPEALPGLGVLLDHRPIRDP